MGDRNRLCNALPVVSASIAVAMHVLNGLAASPAARYLLWLSMYSTAALTSASDAAVPFGGIMPLPLMTEAVSASAPCLISGAHASLSPVFGFIAEWQPLHDFSYTALPMPLLVSTLTSADFSEGSLGTAACTWVVMTLFSTDSFAPSFLDIGAVEASLAGLLAAFAVFISAFASALALDWAALASFTQTVFASPALSSHFSLATE